MCHITIVAHINRDRRKKQFKGKMNREKLEQVYAHMLWIYCQMKTKQLKNSH